MQCIHVIVCLIDREPAELSSLADTLLESPQKSPEKPRRGACVQSLNPQKQAKLREYLSRKTVTKVKSTRPGVLPILDWQAVICFHIDIDYD